MSFDTIISALQADQVDLGISGFTYDEKRKVLFSEPYHESAEVALVNEDSDMAKVEDLAGKTIGAQLGTTGEECANNVEDATVNAIEDMGICVESLKGGAYDAVIMDLPVAENYVAAGGYKILHPEYNQGVCARYVLVHQGRKPLEKGRQGAFWHGFQLPCPAGDRERSSS